MYKIKVNNVNINRNKITIEYYVSKELRKYFNLEEEFFVEFDENIEEVPKAIAVIPFVVNVLPIIWLTNSILELDELDKTFFYSIDEFKKGYIDMYEKASFKGQVQVKRLINCNYEATKKCATFFSGGLDSYSTLINHIDEKPELVSLWGSDVKFEDEEGWNRVKNNIINVGKKYDLKPVFIKSSFRRFIDEGRLSEEFKNILDGGWWYKVQHGIGLIGHIAPYAWKYKLKNQYIAASECEKNGEAQCASYPTIDNHIKFGSCNVIHDQFYFNRQDKVKYIIDYCKKNHEKVELRVCWISDGGTNCCKCEKCYRTIMGILVEGEDPNNYGFMVNKQTLQNLKKYIMIEYPFNIDIIVEWEPIKMRAIENKYLLKRNGYYKDIKWIFKFDFYNCEESFIRKKQRFKNIMKNKIYARLESIKYIFNTIKPINKKKIYILNTPLHTNIGDSAIAYVHNLFLEKNIGNKYKIVEVSSWELKRFRRALSYIIRKKDIVTQLGGGNMGVEWFGEELERRRIIEMFPNNKMIIFPQTIYYGDSDKGKEEFEKSKQIYNSHKDLTVIAREKVSYEIMKNAYDKCKVILTPDIVLSMDGLENKYKRENITFCFRKDPEKVLKNSEQEVIIEECEKITDKLVFTDMISEKEVTKENRVDIIMDKFKDFQKSKLVITDRLHGMVFCAISGTPCIAFGNYNQKVKGTYEWIKDLDYIKYVDNIEEAKGYIDELMNLDMTKYDNSRFINYYGQIKDIINDTFREER